MLPASLTGAIAGFFILMFMGKEPAFMGYTGSLVPGTVITVVMISLMNFKHKNANNGNQKKNYILARFVQGYCSFPLSG
jgi:hypothetical protein